MRPRFPLILLGGCLAVALGSCRASRPEILGLVHPRSTVTVPAGAELEVQVADVTRENEAPVVIARRLYGPLGAPPWPFQLRADSLSVLDPRHAYAVQARVLLHGRPLFVSKRRTTVNPARLADTLEVVVEPVPRTVGVLPGAPAGEAPGAWNPRERPATLPSPVSTRSTGLAGGLDPTAARVPLARNTRPR